MSFTISLNQIKSIVSKSAKQLDIDIPGWQNDIDLETLNLGNCDHCVVGQLNKKSFERTGRNLFNNRCDDMNHDRGFGMDSKSIIDEENMVTWRHGDKPGHCCYTKLTEVWKEEIIARLAV